MEFVPDGTRAQATGACLASLTLIAAGIAIGLLTQRRDALRAVRNAVHASIDPPRGLLQAQRQLIGMLLDEGSEAVPWLAVAVAAGTLSLAGVIGFYTSASL